MEPRLFRDCCEGVLRSFYSGTEVAPRLLLVLFVDDPLIGGVSTFCLPSISHRVEVCYDILCLVFAGRVCVLVAVISVIMITFINVALSLVSQLLFTHVCVWTYSPLAWLQRLESASHPHLLTVVRSASSWTEADALVSTIHFSALHPLISPRFSFVTRLCQKL